MDFEAELKRVRRTGWKIGGSELLQALAVAAGTKPSAFISDRDDLQFNAIRDPIEEHNTKTKQHLVFSPEDLAAIEALPVAEVREVPDPDYTSNDMIRFLQGKGCACTSYYTLHTEVFGSGGSGGRTQLITPEKHLFVYPKDHPERKEQFETLMGELYTHQIDKDTWHRRLGKLLGYPPAEINEFTRRCADDVGRYDDSVDMLNTTVKSEFPALYDLFQRKDTVFSKLLGPRLPPADRRRQ